MNHFRAVKDKKLTLLFNLQLENIKYISLFILLVGCFISYLIKTDKVKDTVANIDFATREQKPSLTQLELVRIGTCGGLQPHTPVGTFICSRKSIGFDGLLNYYAGRNEVCDLAFEEAFTRHMQWNPQKGAPYVIDNDADLLARINQGDMVDGVTIAAGGFFGPQGRKLRIPLEDPDQNDKIMTFEYEGHLITNFEMEGSALAGLARNLGHNAATVCCIIAARYAGDSNTDYKPRVRELVKLALDKLAEITR